LAKFAQEGEDDKGGELGRLDQSAEEYALRAYPATEIPFQLTVNAQSAFNQVKAQGQSKNASGSWSLIGPSTANYPSVLTFSGADYTTSGRITALAIDPACSNSTCRLWVAAAGGGIWRTDNARSGSGANWTFVSGSFATNAIGTLTYAGGILYAGTGEPNASGDSEAGLGIFKSADGGEHWTHLAANTIVPSDSVNCDAVFGTPPGTFGVQTAPAYSGPAFNGRSISSIVVSGGTMYVGSTRGVRGVSSVSGGSASLAPGFPPYGLWKSTDGGATFTLLNSQAVCLNPTLPGAAGIVRASFGSTRGVNHVEVDPGYNGTTNTTLYAAAFPQNNAIPLNTKGGVWRSSDGGATWGQIMPARNPTRNTDRAEFAVTPLPSGDTRMYVGIGNDLVTTANRAHFWRSDSVATGVPSFTDLTVTSPNHETDNYCGNTAAQCWYDNYVVSPAGHPDTVYVGGAYQYGEVFDGLLNGTGVSNGRAVLYSTDAGASFTDMTWDASSATAPNGMHPDQHALVVSPSDPGLFFVGSDGGLMRSSGSFSNVSSQCATRSLSPSNLTRCQQLLSRVPSHLYNLNKGLSTLQFQSLSVAPDNPKHLQGGTQDNGTFETYGSAVVWPQIIYGDGGQSGFNAANSALRLNTFTGQAHDANFQNGDPTKWVIIGGPIASSPESALFYPPIIADPNPTVAGSIFEGSQSVWRTQDWGGNQAVLEANCPEFTASAANPTCGDFVRIGPAGATNLTAASADFRGASRSGGNVAAIERATSDTDTLWTATTNGRVFISKNANAAAGSVTYTRLDTLAANSPGRFVSSIYIDPTNPNHAWISYSGYSALTPATPGHVFEVTYNQGAGTATWTSLDGAGLGALQDLPITDLVRDDTTGDLYASSDFGVMTLANGATSWQIAGSGLPAVEVAGLTIVPGAHVLYAATHGRSAWKLNL
jgi:hypothetical protein